MVAGVALPPELAPLVADLDPAQAAAVLSPGAPLCILAPAGSGKTRVLTRRIARRVLDGSADASHVLVITFTRRAAGELVRRLQRLGLRERVPAGTFHAVAHGLLRQRFEDRGRQPPELLIGRTRLVAVALDRLGPASRRLEVSDVSNEIDWARARRVPPEHYEAEARRAGRRTAAPPEAIAAAYTEYEAVKRHRRVVDFDDLLEWCTREIGRDREFADVVRWRFRHLFVDEFQDVNPLQHALLESLRGDRPDLCVVGDPNQAIYGWNGADPELLRRFADDHPGTTTIRLTHTYRSTPQVLAVARAALVDPDPAPVVVRPDGVAPAIVSFPTEADEAAGIARFLLDTHRPGSRWSSCAVLTRTNAQLGTIEQALRAASIPCRLHGATRLLSDPSVRVQFGLAPGEPGSPGSLRDLADRLDDLVGPGREEGSGDAIRTLAHLAWELLEDEPLASIDRFRAWIAAGGAGDDAALGAPGTIDAVDLCSFHAAKGLEWPVVVVAGVERGLVPHAGATTTSARAEEARLLYVALSRAEDRLLVTWARHRAGATRPERAPSPWLMALAEAATAPGAAPPPAELLPIPARRGPTDPVEVALGVLREWRRHAAQAADLPEVAVCTDAALRAVARARPTTVVQLAALPEIGPIAANRLGPRLLAALAAAAADEDHGEAAEPVSPDDRRPASGQDARRRHSDRSR